MFNSRHATNRTAALADALLRVLLLMLLPIRVIIAQSISGSHVDFGIIFVSLFYYLNNGYFVLSSNPLIVLLVIFYSTPTIFYSYKISIRGREPGSLRFAIKCYLATLVFYFLANSCYSLTVPQYNSDIPSLNQYILPGYSSLIPLLIIVLPELYAQFKSEDLISTGDDTSTNDTLLSRLMHRINASALLFPLAIIFSFSLTLQTGFGPASIQYWFIFTSFLCNVSIATFSSSDLSIFVSTNFPAIDPIFIFNLIFLDQFIEYLGHRVTKRRLMLVTLPFVFIFADYLVSFLFIPFYFSIFVPVVQIVAFLSLRLDLFTNVTIQLEPPKVTGERGPPPEPSEILIKIPYIYIIRTRLRRLLHHE